MDEDLDPFERTCKMIGEKYGPAARELLARIKERKENDRLKQQANEDVDKPSK